MVWWVRRNSCAGTLSCDCVSPPPLSHIVCGFRETQTGLFVSATLFTHIRHTRGVKKLRKHETNTIRKGVCIVEMCATSSKRKREMPGNSIAYHTTHHHPHPTTTTKTPSTSDGGELLGAALSRDLFLLCARALCKGVRDGVYEDVL